MPSPSARASPAVARSVKSPPSSFESAAGTDWVLCTGQPGCGKVGEIHFPFSRRALCAVIAGKKLDVGGMHARGETHAGEMIAACGTCPSHQTTAVKAMATMLAAAGCRVRGFFTEEVRGSGSRIGARACYRLAV